MIRDGHARGGSQIFLSAPLTFRPRCFSGAHFGKTSPSSAAWPDYRTVVDYLYVNANDDFCLSGSSAVVQICNALLQGVLPPATQDPNLNYICVKRITDALGTQQVRSV